MRTLDYTMSEWESLPDDDKWASHVPGLTGATPYHTNYYVCIVEALAQRGEVIPLRVWDSLGNELRSVLASRLRLSGYTLTLGA